MTDRPTALITGASSGIGAEFARQLAGDHDLVLVARRETRLRELAAELAGVHPAGRFDVLRADLSTPTGIQAVLDGVAEVGRGVDLLINNAGAGAHGDFVEVEADRLRAEITLDCTAVASLTRALLPSMIERGRGGVLNVASTAGFQPVPTMAIYGASKAFVISFSQALRYELRHTGVRVTALCPGGVETEFFQASGAQFLTRGRLPPTEVARAGLSALRRGRPVEVPGLSNKLGTLGYRLAPRRILTPVSAWLVRER